MTPSPAAPGWGGAVAGALLLLATGCATRGGVDTSGPAMGYGSPPPLAGSTVLVLPIQAVSLSGVSAASPADPDAELGFALTGHRARVRWVLPPELARARSTSPGVPADPETLPVQAFSAGEVRRIGDPLFGHLRRLGALVDAEWALLPLALDWSETDGGAFRVALLRIRTGQVAWFGVRSTGPDTVRTPGSLPFLMEEFALDLLAPSLPSPGAR